MGLGKTTTVEEMISGTETNLHEALIDGFMQFRTERWSNDQSFAIPDAFWTLDLIPRKLRHN